jgi:hypothetical protein
MGKKRQRTKQVSKGVHCQKRTPEQKASRIEYRQSAARKDNQLLAYIRGKNVMITIPNPDKNNTKERFIKVNGRDYYKFGNK